MELPPGLIYGASWVTITGGVWALFERAETVVAPAIKAEISMWLRNLKGPSIRAWPHTFVQVFDRVFGSRHVSWRCFVRSALASFASIVVVVLVWGALRPSEFRAFVAEEGAATGLIVVLGSGALVNVFPDYLSLLETRFVIGRMKSRGPRGVAL